MYKLQIYNISQIRVVSIITLIIIISACNKTPEYTSFENAISIEVNLEADTLIGHKILENEIAMYQISRFDTLLIVSVQKDTLFNVYSKSDDNYRYIGKFGSIGEGPGELRRPTFLRDIFIENDKIMTLIYDQVIQTLYFVDLLASAIENKMVIQKQTVFPLELMSANQFLFLNETTIVGSYDDRNYMFLNGERGGYTFVPDYTTIVPDNSSIETISFHNFEANADETPALTGLDYALTNINARDVRITPNRSKLVYLTWFAPYLEIIDLNTNSTNKIKIINTVEDNEFVESELNAIEFLDGAIIQYYTSLYITDNFLYLLYSGVELKNRDEPHEKQVLKINYDGEVINKYIIPSEYNIARVVVDEESDQIYGRSSTLDTIYVFNM